MVFGWIVPGGVCLACGAELDAHPGVYCLSCQVELLVQIVLLQVTANHPDVMEAPLVPEEGS